MPDDRDSYRSVSHTAYRCSAGHVNTSSGSCTVSVTCNGSVTEQTSSSNCGTYNLYNYTCNSCGTIYNSSGTCNKQTGSYTYYTKGCGY